MGYSVLTDPKRYIESFLKIKTKEGKIVPFKLNESQEKLYRAIMELFYIDGRADISRYRDAFFT